MSKLLFALENDAVLDPTGPGAGATDDVQGTNVVDGIKEVIGDEGEINLAIEELQIKLNDGIHALTAISGIDDVVSKQIVNEEGLSADAMEVVTIALESIANRLDIKVPMHRMPSLEHFQSKSSRIAASQLALENVVINTLKLIWQKIVAFMKAIVKFISQLWVQIFGRAKKIEVKAKKTIADLQAEEKKLRDELKKEYEDAKAKDVKDLKNAGFEKYKYELSEQEKAILLHTAKAFQVDGRTTIGTVHMCLDNLHELATVGDGVASSAISTLIRGHYLVSQVMEATDTGTEKHDLDLHNDGKLTLEGLTKPFTSSSVFKKHGGSASDTWFDSKQLAFGSFISAHLFGMDRKTGDAVPHLAITLKDIPGFNPKTDRVHTPSLSEAIELARDIEKRALLFSSSTTGTKKLVDQIEKHLEETTKSIGKLSDENEKAVIELEAKRDELKKVVGSGSYGAGSVAAQADHEAWKTEQEARGFFIRKHNLNTTAKHLYFSVGMSHVVVSSLAKILSSQERAFDAALNYAGKAPMLLKSGESHHRDIMPYRG